MANLTLQEVCKFTGVSRRAIQGYEKAGLVSATERNERGHLLYSIESQERIKLIKLFQQIGFSIKDIQKLIDAPKPVLKDTLEKRIEELKGRKEEIDVLIEKVYQFIGKLS